MKWIGLVGWLAATFAVAWIGSRWSGGGPWYDALDKPSWNPPSWIFGPVWTLLYAMMAVAAWLVWRDHGFHGATAALTVFILQLLLNLAWSWIFFGQHRIGAAAAEIVLLWVTIIATILLFRRHSATAAWLMAPYLAWVTFAAVLNMEIWRRNG